MGVVISPEKHSMVVDATWDYYTRTLEEFGPSRGVRVIYDQGRMEIVTTSSYHEMVKGIIGRLIETYGTEADNPVISYGSWTMRDEALAKGLEADDCYYVGSSPPPANQGAFDASIHTPPDLAIEVEVSRGSMPKQPIYAALGVPEIWRFDDRVVVPLHRASETAYKQAKESLAFPRLPMDVLNQFLQQAITGPFHEAIKSFRDWARANPPKL